MRILMVSSQSETGGAAVVARRLMTGLKEAGHRVHLLAGFGAESSEEVTVRVRNGRDRLKLFRNAAAAGIERLTGWHYQLQPHWRTLTSELNLDEYDIVHFHNTHGCYAHLDVVWEAAAEKPVVWTLHDMFPFTGHCGHAGWAKPDGCERWKTGCGECPALAPLLRDTTASLWKHKAEFAKKFEKRIVIVSPSEWLKTCAEQSLLAPLIHKHISNALPPGIFKPVADRAVLRNELGLPRDRFVLCFSAVGGMDSEFKGGKLLLAALEKLRSENLNSFLLTLGGEKSNSSDALNAGHVRDPQLLAKYYAAADAFVLPSIAENQPLVVMEALACGTPIIAYAVGGIPEMIEHKSTGYLAKPRDVNDLAAGLRWAMQLSAGEMENARTRAAKAAVDYELKAHVNEYVEAYEQSLKIWTSR